MCIAILNSKKALPKEYLSKNVRINVPSWGEKTGEDWSICCEGKIIIERETSTIIIEATNQCCKNTTYLTKIAAHSIMYVL